LKPTVFHLQSCVVVEVDKFLLLGLRRCMLHPRTAEM